jgi:hypothetical protein
MKESDNVNHPAHYESGPLVAIECIDIARHLSFCRGNAFKYVWRCGKKGGKEQAIDDLRKALWYLNDEEKNYKPHDLFTAQSVLQLAFKYRSDNDFEKERRHALVCIVTAEDSNYEINTMIAMLESEEHEQ